jgi:glycosyltransferase involved in cell wall biosynthesis
MQKTIEKLIKSLIDKDTRSFRDRGDAARDIQDWKAAASFYDRHLAGNPADFEIWVQLGHALKEVGEFKRARVAYSQAMSLRPSDADLFLNFGRLEVLMQNPKEAMLLFRKSNEIDGNPHALNELESLIGGVREDMIEQQSLVSIDDQMRKVLTSGFFDPAWYLEKYPDLDPGFMGALQHFVKHGAFEWRSPGPFFDSEWYMLQNPDLRAAVEARLLNPLLHYLEHGAKEGRKPLPPSPTMFRNVKELLDDILDIDPAFYATSNFRTPKSLRVYDPVPKTESFKTFKRAFDLLDSTYEYVIVIPWLIHGGAELMALNMAKAISELKGPRSVLIMAVDYARKDAYDWLPHDVDFLALQDDNALLGVHDTAEALLYLLQALRPKSVINVNSMACWEVYRQHGRALSQMARLYGCAFCRDYNDEDFPSGYADTHVRDTLAWLNGLISDNQTFFTTITKHFSLPEEISGKFIPIYNPAPGFTNQLNRSVSGPGETIEHKKKFKVLWASRYTRQKNISLLRQIASSSPDIVYEVWGRGDCETMLREASRDYPNLRVMGPYASFRALPFEEYGAFLYTSLWDGIPNVLLEAASAGLPIVSSSVGGISELIDGKTGWLIENLHDAQPYVTSLRAIRDDRETVFRRQSGMRERLQNQHSWEQFVGTISNSGIVEVTI